MSQIKPENYKIDQIIILEQKMEQQQENLFDLDDNNYNNNKNNQSAISLEPSLNGNSQVKDRDASLFQSNSNKIKDSSALKKSNQSEMDQLNSHFSGISIEQNSLIKNTKYTESKFGQGSKVMQSNLNGGSKISEISNQSFGIFINQNNNQGLNTINENQYQNQYQGSSQYPQFDEDQQNIENMYDNTTSDLEIRYDNNSYNNQQGFQQYDEYQNQDQNQIQQKQQQQYLVKEENGIPLQFQQMQSIAQQLQNDEKYQNQQYTDDNQSVINTGQSYYQYEQQQQQQVTQKRSDKVCQCNKGCKAPCGCRKRGEKCIQGCACVINNTFCMTNDGQEIQPVIKGYCGCDKNECQTQQCECFKNNRLCNDKCRNCLSIKSNCKLQTQEELDRRKQLIEQQKREHQEKLIQQQENERLIRELEEKRQKEIEKRRKEQQQNQ